MEKLPRLRLVRQKCMLTEQRLADLAGMSKATISNIETGRRAARYGTIEKLAKALGVDPKELRGEVEAS
ncbi:MAG: helix-turn-helix transcriptional regulator [Patescibacteria group bacterium]|nr:helix-turn-helix transcriptional regulator [Patescibacteria group bacterium]